VASGSVSVLLAKTLRSSTFKLALIAIGVFGIVVFALIGYLYWSTTSYARYQSDRAIAAEQLLLRAAYEIGGRDGLVSAITRCTTEGRSDCGVYLLADTSFTPIAGTLKAWPLSLKGREGWNNIEAGESRPDVPNRPQLRVLLTTLPDGSHLLVGRNLDAIDAFVDTIHIALACNVALLAILAGVASFSVTRRTVGRIESINATSRAIMQSGLGQRIPLRGTRDEWDHLAENLNSMLGRIEELMAEVKQVTDNVAHDLRTPLTRMRARLEKAHGRPRDADRDQSLIGDILTDLDTVLGTFSSLLRISQIESKDRSALCTTMNLTEIASEVVELFDAAAEDRGGHLELCGEPRVLVTGDRDLLFNAVANLVDNAIKHGGEAGRVTVHVARGSAGPLVSVADRGPGIPFDERQHVFKRFYRLESSRHAPGNGLGLSLVAAVANLHGARIEMLDNGPGLEFRLWFPQPAYDG
jgi:signal transduction histidine kinase